MRKSFANKLTSTLLRLFVLLDSDICRLTKGIHLTIDSVFIIGHPKDIALAQPSK